MGAFIVIIAILVLLVLYQIHTVIVMKEKAEQAQICYEDLKGKLEIETDAKIIFSLSAKRFWQMLFACFKDNPFPKVKVVLCFLRLKAVVRLFKRERVVQTGPAAAALTLNAVLCNEIAKVRNGKANANPIECDVAFSGLSVVRLYMMAYGGNDGFKEERCNSGMRVNNALNGSFYKYETKDGRKFSAHVYYESQKAKLMKALELSSEPKKFTMDTMKKDKVDVTKVMKKYTGLELEELAFSSGASGCMLRSRQEWELAEFGKAVCEMPLFRLKKVADAPVKTYGPSGKKGPLSGIKVLDLTHIIAGPACTRLLAEQGAEVTLVRRGRFENQEQAMLELDGWAGKHLVSLDFNDTSQLEQVKQLVRESDVIVSSYQYGVFDKFGLSKEDIHTLNPNLIYGSMTCFSDSIWQERPGWAPLAEDITGLSIRNGSIEKPKNLNGVPLDYIPGFILCCGILKALKLSMTVGGSYDVSASLTRAGYWLHECTDICERGTNDTVSSRIQNGTKTPLWNEVLHTVEDTAVGTVKFPAPAVWQEGSESMKVNMRFWE